MKSLVLGGNSGIGSAIVEAMTPGEVHHPSVAELDVRYPSSVEGYINVKGPYDQVVYCAGFNLLEMIGSLDGYLDVIDINYVGFIRVLDALMQPRIEKPPCNIVAIVSDASRVAMRGSIAYCSSKAGLAHAIRCAARELSEYGWRVNGVSPTVVAGTPMTAYIDATVPQFRGWTPDQARAYEQSSIPIKRRVFIEEVVQVVLQVLEGPAAMTGSIIEITGGK
jgi:NAD(P)-dependent dehydrogenase (short-subunit alcohol dehydrogenase family)